jgi:hypothetical protein
MVIGASAGQSLEEVNGDHREKRTLRRSSVEAELERPLSQKAGTGEGASAATLVGAGKRPAPRLLFLRGAAA